jgi:hypothetical protein
MLTELSCEVSDSLVSGGQPIRRIPLRGGAVLRSSDLTPSRARKDEALYFHGLWTLKLATKFRV